MGEGPISWNRFISHSTPIGFLYFIALTLYMGFALPFYRSLYKAEFFYIYAPRSAGHILWIFLDSHMFLGVS
jgi:hypothetical protein